MATGPELTRSGRDILEAAGWETWTFNSEKPLPVGLRGLSIDILAIRHNHVLFLECKGDGDTLKPKDEQFAVDISPHIGDHLVYFICWSEDDFLRVVNFGRQNDYA